MTTKRRNDASVAPKTRPARVADTTAFRATGTAGTYVGGERYILHYDLRVEWTAGVGVRLVGEADALEHVGVRPVGRRPHPLDAGNGGGPAHADADAWAASLAGRLGEAAALQAGAILFDHYYGKEPDRRQAEDAFLDFVEENGGDRAWGVSAFAVDAVRRVARTAVDRAFAAGDEVCIGGSRFGRVVSIGKKTVVVDPDSVILCPRKVIRPDDFVRLHSDPELLTRLAERCDVVAARRAERRHAERRH